MATQEEKTVEFHFQEGFNGEPVILRKDGRVIREFMARTRMQVGFAEVVRASFRPGEVVRVELKNGGAAAELTLRPEDQWISINLKGNELVMRRDGGMPRYA